MRCEKSTTLTPLFVKPATRPLSSSPTLQSAPSTFRSAWEAAAPSPFILQCHIREIPASHSLRARQRWRAHQIFLGIGYATSLVILAARTFQTNSLTAIAVAQSPPVKSFNHPPLQTWIDSGSFWLFDADARSSGNLRMHDAATLSERCQHSTPSASYAPFLLHLHPQPG